MFALRKRFRFEAAHRLPLHDGKCARLHGHSWQGIVEVAGNRLHEAADPCVITPTDSQRDCPKAGMLLDYGDIARVLAPVVENFLDHHYLNESLALESPTSEEIARWLYDALQGSEASTMRLPGLVAVTIEETCTSACEYRPYGGVSAAGGLGLLRIDSK